MATPSTAPASATSRKVFRLGVFIVLFIAVYSVAWYFAAEYLRRQIVAFFEGGNPAAITANCEQPRIGGYPFRFRLNCDRLSLDDNYQGISASFGAVRAAAQIYAPGHVVWELDGPAEIRSARGFNTTIEWDDLFSSFNASLSGLDRSSLEIRDLKAKLISTTGPLQLELTAPHAESHIRQQEGDLDYAALVREATLAIGGQPLALPPASASLDVTFADRGGLLQPALSHAQTLYGTNGEIRRFVADLGEGRVLTLSGPFSVGNEGLISGQLRIEIEGMDAWNDALGTAYPQMKDTFDDINKVLTVMSLGRDKASAEITIRDGVASLGFIPLGEIPPL
ncbi:DUF2125 domain-containing protein [Rhizobium sp. 18065]|uniref:DUF2125 domain-containing protein n=1 Tax=Rhizobium sp. 18065 TaxID=2681411 RepID=UPI001356938F|nr:DUF2125 domain-containing protein [Rhizobium sp. 18065]